jgi:hypothetical protein
MKRFNCRSLFGKLLLCAGLLFVSAPASHAQSADNVGGTSFGNFGAGGAYGDFDLTAQAATFNPAAGNVANSLGATGAYGNTSYRTNEAPGNNHFGNSQNTGKQLASTNGMGTLNLPVSGMSPLDKVYGGAGRSLPKTTLDSFVMQAGGSADQIYGDEGSEGPPPFFGFDESHYIGTGIQSGGLTTGHHSGLPSAWGYPQ